MVLLPIATSITESLESQAVTFRRSQQYHENLEPAVSVRVPSGIVYQKAFLISNQQVV